MKIMFVCHGNICRSPMYDLFIGMDSANIRNMLRIFGSDPDGKVHKLINYTDRGGDVADPWYSERFDLAYRDIYDGCTALLDAVLSGTSNETRRKE